MGFSRWPIKDPDERLDYTIDWTARLDGDTIQSSVWVIPSGLSNYDDSFTNISATVWLTGGIAGQEYEVTNRVTTAAGRIMDQTVRLPVRAK